MKFVELCHVWREEDVLQVLEVPLGVDQLGERVGQV